MKTRLLISFVFVGVVIFGITNSSGVLDGITNRMSGNNDWDDIPLDCKGYLGKCYSGVVSKM